MDPREAVVVDVENLWGKMSFEMNHSDLINMMIVWTLLRNRAAGSWRGGPSP